MRVIRALDELGIASVAVYSEADRDAQHVQRADEAYLLGPGPAAESYLKVDKLLEVIERVGRRGRAPRLRLPGRERRRSRTALRGGGHHVHRAARVGDRGDGLQDPRPRADAGRPACRSCPARPSRSRRSRTRAKIAEDDRLPDRGQGRGRRRRQGLPRRAGARQARRTRSRAPRARARSSSPTPTVYLERYLPDPRHVEVQVLADSHGNVIHLGERDCSIQRRHQKLIEESPAPLVDDELRERIGKIAIDAAHGRRLPRRRHDRGPAPGRRVLLPRDEHARAGRALRDRGGRPGIDIVREQIRIAAGEPLSVAQDDVVLRGHAIECRINAEDAAKNFAPAPGTIDALPRADRPRRARRLRRAAPARRSRRCTTRWSPS